MRNRVWVMVGWLGLPVGMLLGLTIQGELPSEGGQIGSRVVAAEPKSATVVRTPADDGKLRIICFGAHPDDCELRAGGSAILWASQGHHVKFVSVTNGDIGHWRDAGGPLARRRKAEVESAARIIGNASEVLDIHDGELLPTLDNRRAITRLIREWKADKIGRAHV